jgi:hypothetical protein
LAKNVINAPKNILVLAFPAVPNVFATGMVPNLRIVTFEMGNVFVKIGLKGDNAIGLSNQIYRSNNFLTLKMCRKSLQFGGRMPTLR